VRTIMKLNVCTNIHAHTQTGCWTTCSRLKLSCTLCVRARLWVCTHAEYDVSIHVYTRTYTGALTARSSTSKMSLKSHPPPKDEKWARFTYDMKKKWKPVYEQRIGSC
jgi:hypothetical protein